MQTTQSTQTIHFFLSPQGRFPILPSVNLDAAYQHAPGVSHHSVPVTLAGFGMFRQAMNCVFLSLVRLLFVDWSVVRRHPQGC